MIESHSQRVTRRDVLAGAGSALIAAGGGASASEAARGTRKIDTSPGEHVLKFDMPGLRIGSAVYPEGPTGCTVFHFPKRARGVVDIRGGAPATFWTDAMRRGAAPVDAQHDGLGAAGLQTELRLPFEPVHWGCGRALFA